MYELQKNYFTEKTKAGPDQQNHPTLYPWTTPNSRKRVANPFAPANCQALASSLKACTACCKLGTTPSNTQAFLCFQIIHAPRMQKELKPFLRCFCSFFSAFFHQSAKDELLVGVRLVKASCCRMAHQNCLAKTHEVRMCWIVSSSWSQSTHRSTSTSTKPFNPKQVGVG